jgi:hypothetical protein
VTAGNWRLRDRRSDLQNSTPDELTLVWSGDFGDRAQEIEAGTKTLLRPWRIRGEWFDASPLLAGVAIEAARDGTERLVLFLDRMAKCFAVRPNWKLEDEMDEAVEKDFPDLYPRIGALDPGTWTDWRGKTHPLPHRKFTRIMVSGMPETTYGCPLMPPHIHALENYKAARAKKS